MKRLLLPATLASDLDWTSQREEALSIEDEILWEFDFGRMTFDRGAFHAYVLAIEQFSAGLWKEFSSRSKGIVLYRGSLGIINQIMTASEEVEAATLFGDFLHRLASFLPDDVAIFCLFEKTPFNRGRSAQLMSKERFLHLRLELEENRSPVGILLPPDELCTPLVLKKLEQCMELAGPHRMIPEQRLNEMWDGLDLLYVIEEAVSAQGKRHLKGFEAAGGKTFGAEGFEPPTYCSQSSRASQAALCSEQG